MKNKDRQIDETERDRETDRQRERETETDRQTDRKTERFALLTHIQKSIEKFV